MRLDFRRAVREPDKTDAVHYRQNCSCIVQQTSLLDSREIQVNNLYFVTTRTGRRYTVSNITLFSDGISMHD